MKQEYEIGWKLVVLNLAIGLGTFMQVLDTSIANVAVPYIAGNLGVSADQGTWVITSFAASNAVVLPLTGWLSNYFGSVRLFVWSIILFSITSILCGMSRNLDMLVAFRTIQGAVAGSLIPLSQSLLVASNPPEKQGIAQGFWGVIVIVAPILGPIIGGYLTYVYSWPWIFYINVPIGFFSATVTWMFLKDRETTIVRNPIDWWGLALFSTGIVTLQIMLDRGKDLDWFESNIIILLTLISIITLVYFVIWNHYQKYPLVDFSFFKNRNFVLGTVAITIGFLVYFGSTVTIPLWLQTEQNYTPLWAGIAVAPVGIAPFLLFGFVGKFMNRFDLRKLAFLSFSLFSIGFFFQANFTTNVSLYEIMFARFLQGFGLPFFFLPLVQLSLGEIPKEKYASASGLFNFVRILVGSGFGTSLSIELWSRLEIFHHARLSESVTAFRHVTTQFYTMLSNVSSAFTIEVIDRVVDSSVEQQAYMLSTNDLSWLGAWLFILMLPLFFFFKRVKKKEQGSGTAAH